jgi:hypothetical protein
MKEEQLELDFTPKPSLASGQAALDAILTRSYLQCLDSDSWRVRRKGIHGLVSNTHVDGVAVERIETLLKDPDARVRQAAQIALAQIRERSKQ